ncbi:hypothetical protein C8Q80DRAFT_843780 [Daedaleopsis nitida]|nr:hypothetical protein C8Q80DRAFT_843780 [Daedaleopsis nitida]
MEAVDHPGVMRRPQRKHERSLPEAIHMQTADRVQDQSLRDREPRRPRQLPYQEHCTFPSPLQSLG